MPEKKAKIQARKGAPKGNTRTNIHGCYGSQVMEHEKAVWRKIKNGSIERFRVLDAPQPHERPWWNTWNTSKK